YEVAPVILPACGINAPHRRDRIWIIAHSNKRRVWPSAERINLSRELLQTTERQESQFVNQCNGYVWTITNSERIRQQGQGRTKGRSGTTKDSTWKASWSHDDDRWPTQPPLRVGNDGLSSNMVRSAIRGAGNAIVPQIAFQIFKAIEQV